MNETVQRNFSEFTWTEIKELGGEDGGLGRPIGAIEQHGPHLSVDCDLVFADRFMDMTLAKINEDLKVWRLPILAFSKSVRRGVPTVILDL